MTLQGDYTLGDSVRTKSWLLGAQHYRRTEGIRIALINNMPDAALEDTELQFFELLHTAADGLPLFVKLYSLPGVPRSDKGQQRLSAFYRDIDDLWKNQFDAAIITGTEPRQLNLREEPYWHTLADIFDWAQDHTISTVLSCLAAHASVLHSDGIERHTMVQKRFGVFDSIKVCNHSLLADTDAIRFPHSRWNEVPEDALVSCGYSVLTESDQAGVDIFVRQKCRSLFVHFQGHPEYGAGTLLKEYRRDVRRFLRGERETYPSTPQGYLDQAANKLMADFQQKALSDRREELLAGFPDVTENLQHTWHSSAVGIYRNWLRYIATEKVKTGRSHLSNRFDGIQVA